MKEKGKKRLRDVFKIKFVQNVLLALLSALLFYFMINFKLYSLVWIVLVPIFYVGFRERKLLFLLFYGFLTAFTIFIFSFSWLSVYSIAFFWTSSLVVGFFGILIAFLYFLMCKIEKFYGYRFFYYSLIWLFLAFLFSFWEYGNMWMLFAYLQPMMYPLGYVLGPLFYTIFIVLFNSLVAYYLFEKKKWVLGLLILFFLLILFSFVYSSYASVDGEELNVALVQGMVGHEWTWRLKIPDKILEKYENLTLGLKGQKVDIIIWPEYSIPADFSVNKSLKDRVGNLAVEMESYIVLGAFSYVDKENIGLFDDKTDRVLIFSPEGVLVDYYDASRVISYVGDIVPVEEKKEAIELEEFSFNLGLCFEEYMDKGSIRGDTGDFVVITTNNHHFDGTAGLDLIAQFSRLKALEKHKYVLRSTNSGITQIVNPYGRVVSRLSSSNSGVLFGKIYI